MENMEMLRPVIMMIPRDTIQVNVQCLQDDGSVERYTYMLDDIKKCYMEPKGEDDGEK